MKIISKLWILIGVLIVLSPLGLLLGLVLPEQFKAGAAWGEWGADKMRQLVGYIPKGLEKLSSIWNAPITDYAFKGWENKSLQALSLAYIVSALIGVLAVVCVVLLIAKILRKK